jgi:hypothetical protein
MKQPQAGQAVVAPSKAGPLAVPDHTTSPDVVPAEVVASVVIVVRRSSLLFLYGLFLQYLIQCISFLLVILFTAAQVY